MRLRESLSRVTFAKIHPTSRIRSFLKKRDLCKTKVMYIVRHIIFTTYVPTFCETDIFDAGTDGALRTFGGKMNLSSASRNFSALVTLIGYEKVPASTWTSNSSGRKAWNIVCIGFTSVRPWTVIQRIGDWLRRCYARGLRSKKHRIPPRTNILSAHSQPGFAVSESISHNVCYI